MPFLAETSIDLNPISLAMHSKGVVLAVLVLLLAASLTVWFIIVVKLLQLGRLRSAQHAFERATEAIINPSDLISASIDHRGSPGGRVVMELGKRHHQPGLSSDLLQAVAKRAIVNEQKRAGSLMPTLSSIASASPFIGLFGTVWGIMEAFMLIGREKSASLPVVAPAIGEALIATAVGLFAAIPATIGYNYIDRKVSDLLDELEASSDAWVEIVAGNPGGPSSTLPLVRRTGDVTQPTVQEFGR